MTTLTATTEYGVFNRKTKNAYTHVVVRVPVDREAVLARAIACKGLHTSDIAAKDRGYEVTWHRRLDLAEKAAATTNPSRYPTAIVATVDA